MNAKGCSVLMLQQNDAYCRRGAMWALRELGQIMNLWGKPILFGFVLAKLEWPVDLLGRPKNFILWDFEFEFL